MKSPDGVRDYHRKVDNDHRYVGEGVMSLEGSSQVDYLWRAPPSIPFPRPRSHKVGEIGWAVPDHADFSAASSGNQIQLGEFRQLVEDRYTHLYQNAWYPGPQENVQQDSDADLVMNVYKTRQSPSNTANQGRDSDRRGSAYSNYSEHSNNNNSNNNNNTDIKSVQHQDPVDSTA